MGPKAVALGLVVGRAGVVNRWGQQLVEGGTLPRLVAAVVDEFDAVELPISHEQKYLAERLRAAHPGFDGNRVNESPFDRCELSFTARLIY